MTLHTFFTSDYKNYKLNYADDQNKIEIPADRQTSKRVNSEKRRLTCGSRV